MTKYVRIPGKIFAENASPVGNDPQIGKFGNAKQGIYTGEADVQEIQNSEAWSQGWTSAVVSAMNYPPLPEMNGVLKVLSYQICYLLQKGIPEWNADTIYYKNDYVNYNGKLYYSNIDNNTFEPETPLAGNSWLSGTSDVALYVKKSGDTMTGKLFFDSYMGAPIEIDCSKWIPDWNNTPIEENKYINLHFCNGKKPLGNLSISRLANGGRDIHLNCVSPVDDTDYSASIAAGYDGTGNAYAVTCQPAKNSNGRYIATTNWVRQHLNTSGGALGSWKKAQNGYIKLSNGIIIQWGTTAIFTGNKQKKEITLPTAFSNYTYIITTGIFGDTNSDDNIFITSKTTTSFSLWSTSVGHNDGTWNLVVNWIAIGY